MTTTYPPSSPDLWNILYFPFIEKSGGAWFLCDDYWHPVEEPGYGYKAYMRCIAGHYNDDGSNPVIPGGVHLQLTKDEFNALRGTFLTTWGTTDQDLVPLPLSGEHARHCTAMIAGLGMFSISPLQHGISCKPFQSLNWTDSEYRELEAELRDVLERAVFAKLQSIRRS